jgi:Transcription factor S-II (TFIIS), central domain
VSDGATASNRVPWDVLVVLRDHLPNTDLLVGAFKQIVLNVMEIYACASRWQEDITNLTNLSLRGGTRRGRNPSFKGSSVVADSVDSLPYIDFDKLVSLSKSPILAKVRDSCRFNVACCIRWLTLLFFYMSLSKVYMPREDGIREMVESTFKFESLFQNFFAVEYFGDSFDLLIVPKDDSLVGEDGTFHLRRFTGSPFFEALRSAISQISGFLTTMVVSSTKRVAFDWLRSVFSWIDLLDSSVAADGPYFQHLSIASSKANEIILGWGAIFQDIPEELVTFLDEYCIDIKLSPGESMSVDTRNGCCHNSFGALLLRWCPFIYDGLKMDFSAVSEWEYSAKKLLNEFGQFQQHSFGYSPSDPKVMQAYYKNRDETSRLLNSTSDLFLTPDFSLVDNCLSLLKLSESHIKTYSNPEALKAFAETQYFCDEAVVRNRHRLLEALSERVALALRPLDLSMDRKSGDGTLRQQCQTSFLRALLKTLSIVGLEDSNELHSLCAFKAWDIEKCLHDLCSESKQETEQKQLYHSKGMTLKRFLGDLSNLTLILKVLNDEILASQLVRMDAEELANAMVKKSREEATEAARQRLLLTGSQVLGTEAVSRKPPAAAKVVSVVNASTAAASRPSASTKNFSFDPQTDVVLPTPSQNQAAKSSTSSSSATKPSASLKTDNVARMEAKPSLVIRKSSSDDVSGSPHGRGVKISDLVSKKRASGPPPPPPSLVQMSLARGRMTPAAVPRTTVAPMHSIANASGGYQFTLIVQHNDEFHRQFQASFVAEADSKRVAGNKRLSETLRQRGRMGGEDLLKFLAEKMSTGRNEILSFKVVPVSDSDTRALQQTLEFFTDRILMLRSDGIGHEGGEKAYLVSPRFHRFCERYVTFDDTNSSYVVLVVKKSSQPK